MDLPNVPRTVLGLTWREHIGGRWAVSAVGFAVITPIALLAVLINVQSFVGVDLAWWVLASALSMAVMGAVWWLASVTVLRNRRTAPVTVWVVVFVGFLSGAARSIVATVLTVEWGLFPAPEGLTALLPARAAVGGVQGAVGLPVLAMCLSLIDRYRGERARLLTQLAGVRQRRAEEAGAAAALRDALSGPVQTRLRELADRLGQDTEQIDVVASDVRSQAHELWSRSQVVSHPPRVRIRDVLRISLSIKPLPLFALWAIWLPSAVLTLATRNPIGVALGQSALGALVLTSVYLAGGALARRLPAVGPLMFLLGTLGGGALAGLSMLVLVGGRLTDGNVALIVVSTVWLVGVTLVVSIVESAVRRSEQVLTELETTIDADEVSLYLEEQARSELAQEVASVLHGVVQGRLAVAQRSSDQSVALARQALDEGIELLSRSSVTTAVSARQIVEDVTRPWSALMRIETDVEEGMVPAAGVRDVADVIEECLSNAFRHGAAERVRIEVGRDARTWVVRVSDDGSGSSGSSSAGLGSSLLDAVSGGDWSRSANDVGGCAVTVRLVNR